MSIVAALQTEAEAVATAKQATSDQNTVLEWLRRHPGISVRDIAANAGWVNDKGEPNPAKVFRLLGELRTEKLAEVRRKKWRITDAGKKELGSE